MPSVSLNARKRNSGAEENARPDSFVLRGWDINAAVAQYKADVRQAGLGANLGPLPEPKLVAMLCQQLADQCEACLILWLSASESSLISTTS